MPKTPCNICTVEFNRKNPDNPQNMNHIRKFGICSCLSFLTVKLTSVPHVFMFPSILHCISPVFPPLRSHPQLQTPTVKGFDFAKLHLGQHSKDDVMVIQEAAPAGPGSGALPMSSKDGLSPSENGELAAPTAPSTKASRSSGRRER